MFLPVRITRQGVTPQGVHMRQTCQLFVFDPGQSIFSSFSFSLRRCFLNWTNPALPWQRPLTLPPLPRIGPRNQLPPADRQASTTVLYDKQGWGPRQTPQTYWHGAVLGRQVTLTSVGGGGGGGDGGWHCQHNSHSIPCEELKSGSLLALLCEWVCMCVCVWGGGGGERLWEWLIEERGMVLCWRAKIHNPVDLPGYFYTMRCRPQKH